MEYTREQIIDICEKAIVKQEDWKNRDSCGAQIGVGSCLALLKAGCYFEVLTKPTSKRDMCVTDEDTIWIQLYVKDFMYFEYGGDEKGRPSEDAHFYLPTPKKLEEANGKDWY